MDLISILEKAQSSDIVESENAEIILNEIADYNMEGYLVGLTKILNDTKNTISIRKTVTQQIKKALKSGDDQETRLDYQARWFALQPSVRRLIKDAVLDCLGTEKISPSPAADLLAFIAAAELPNDSWPDLITDLAYNITNNCNSDEIKEASLTAICLLCRQNYECQKCRLMLEQSDEILKSILYGLLHSQNNDLMTTAIYALREWIRFKKGKPCSTPQILSAIQRVLELAQSDEIGTKVASLKCLRKCRLSYTNPQLCKIMVEAIKSQIQEIRVQGFKFWYEQCFEEATGIQTHTERVLNNKFTKETLPNLLPIMLEALTTYGHDENDGNKIWMLANDSVRVLSEWCDVTTLRNYLTLYVQQQVRHQDWRYRSSAIRAYYALFWTKRDNLQSLINKALPVLIDMLEKDRHSNVRCTTAKVIGGVCSKIQDLTLLESHLNAVVEGLLKGLKDELNVICGVCEAFEDLTHKAFSLSDTSENFILSSHFESIVVSLLETLKRPDITKSCRCSVYNALKCLLQYSSTDCYFIFNTTATVFEHQLRNLQSRMPQQSGDTCQYEDSYDTETVALLRALQTLVRIMAPVNLTTNYGKILNSLVQILKRPHCQIIIRTAILETVALIVKALGESFSSHAEELMSLVISDLRNRRKEQVCIAAVQLVHAVCNAIKGKFLAFCDKMIPILLENLNNENTNRRIKNSILLTFGDIAIAVGRDFKKYMEIILASLILAQSELDKEFMMDNRLYSLYTHHNYFLTAYTGIMQGMKDDQESVNVITKLLEPQLKNMIQVITLMAVNKSEYSQMDDFYYSQAINFLNKIYTVFGKNIQHLVDNSAIMTILKSRCSSGKEETKKLSKTIMDKLNQHNVATIKSL